MHVLLCAAGSQSRWNQTGGEGLKQFVTVDGEPVVQRAHRLASHYATEITTLVRDPDLPCWDGLNAQRPTSEEWMGEMGKFLDGRPYWPATGGVVVLYGDVYYTEAVIDRIFGHEPDQPTIYGRATAAGRRLESFGFRFDVDHTDEVDRVARECAEHGLNVKGGPWRWFHRRHTGADKYSSTWVQLNATEANGWVELAPDETDDFDKLADLTRWRETYGLQP